MDAVIEFVLGQHGNNSSVFEKEMGKVIREQIPEKIQYISSDSGYNNIIATYKGSLDQNYEIRATIKRPEEFQISDHKKNWAQVTCTCPIGSRHRLCKHGIGLLVSRVSRLALPQPPQEQILSPSRQQPPLDNDQNALFAMPASNMHAGGSRILPSSFVKIAAKFGNTLLPQNMYAFQHIEISYSTNNNFLMVLHVCSSKRNTQSNKVIDAQMKNRRENAFPVDDHDKMIKKKRWMTSEEMLKGTDEELLNECRREVGEDTARGKEEDDMVVIVDDVVKLEVKEEPTEKAGRNSSAVEKNDDDVQSANPYLDLFNSML